MGAIGTAQAQKSMRQIATLKKCSKFIFDKVGQARSGFRLNLYKESLNMFLYQLIQNGLFWSPSFIVDTVPSRRMLSWTARILLARLGAGYRCRHDL